VTRVAQTQASPIPILSSCYVVGNRVM